MRLTETFELLKLYYCVTILLLPLAYSIKASCLNVYRRAATHEQRGLWVNSRPIVSAGCDYRLVGVCLFTVMWFRLKPTQRLLCWTRCVRTRISLTALSQLTHRTDNSVHTYTLPVKMCERKADFLTSK